ncbi:MAG: T9SS type A sorting domain-containing protein [Sphingobacteriales bacterium]|nr:T9SS type A sorting domain-containing protein [Sphingobacteriales bacterium]
MKRVFYTLLIIMIAATCMAQGWTRMPDFPTGTRYGGIGIGVGAKGYVGLGADAGQIRSDWWEFDPVLKTWTQKADFPGTARMTPIAFAIAGKAYVGTGLNMYTVYSDFYQYDPASNDWTRKADYEGGPRYGAMAFSIGDKGYTGCGKDQGLYDGNNDFWEYDPVTDDWIRKADVGPVHRSFGAAFSAGNKGYIGLGAEGYDTRKKDFWEYDPATDSWLQKADFPAVERLIPYSFGIGEKGYVGMGYYYSPQSDFWEYNPADNAWTQKEENIPRGQGVSFSIGSKGYAGLGYFQSGDLSDFWEYSPTAAELLVCDQTWMPMNLAVTTYRNGDPIPQVTDNSEWVSLTSGAWCYYNNDPSTEAAYGKLYNWYAVTDPRGLAPAGWHIPDYGEWIVLENCAGGYFTAGGALKETGTTHWTDPNTGATNSTGFTALPGGMRTGGGGFMSLGQVGNWWSSSSGSYTHYGITFTGGYYRSIFYGSAIFYGNQAYMGYPSYPISDFKTGMSVRCVKDMAPSFVECPATQTVYSTATDCGVAVTYNATATGNPGPAITYSFSGVTTANGTGTGSGQVFNRGITTVTLTATSSAGTANCIFNVEVLDTIKPVVTCPPLQELCYQDNHNYVIPALTATDNCGIQTTTYSITGATSRSGSNGNASGFFNVGISHIYWTVTDSSGNSRNCQTTVWVNPKINVIFPDVYTAVLGRANTVYIGYGFYYAGGYGFNVVALTPLPTGGTPFYTSWGIPYYHYQWSTGSTAPVLVVSHNTPGYYTYTVTITDAKGCSTTVSKTIRVVDVRCNKNVWGLIVKGVSVCRPGNVQKCVFEFLVWAEVLAHAEIGPCGAAKETAYELKQEAVTAKLEQQSSVTVNSWAEKAGLPAAGRFGAIGFGIGNKGYIGLGMNTDDELYKDFWEFDPAGNVWTQKADFGGTARALATGFSIGNRGYAGTGLDAEGWRKDFWQYDPASNNWTRKKDFGGTARAFATGISINGKGYIGTGYDLNDSLMNDFWEYQPLTNNWIRKADFAGSERYAAAGFSINGKGYIGTGIDIERQTRDFWQYDPLTDSWNRKADFAGFPRHLATGFSIGCRGYIGTGLDSSNTIRADFWEYDPSADNWNQKAGLDGGARLNPVGFSIAGRGYIGTGISMEGTRNDFWEYAAGCYMSLSIPDVYAVNPGGEKNTIYLGYGPSSLTLAAVPSCGNLAPGETYSYAWSDGSTGASATVHPVIPGSHEYSVTVTDSYGCTATASVTIQVVDIRCGNNKVTVCHIPPGNPANQKTICVSRNAVPALLQQGSRLGNCNAQAQIGKNGGLPVVTTEEGRETLQVYPNPNHGIFDLRLTGYTGAALLIEVLDGRGIVIRREWVPAGKGYGTIRINLGMRAQGVYFVKVSEREKTVTAKIVVW